MMGQTVSMFTSTILPKNIHTYTYENVVARLGYCHNSYTLYGLLTRTDPVVWITNLD
jgi:hypothetical protein